MAATAATGGRDRRRDWEQMSYRSTTFVAIWLAIGACGEEERGETGAATSTPTATSTATATPASPDGGGPEAGAPEALAATSLRVVGMT